MSRLFISALTLSLGCGGPLSSTGSTGRGGSGSASSSASGLGTGGAAANGMVAVDFNDPRASIYATPLASASIPVVTVPTYSFVLALAFDKLGDVYVADETTDSPTWMIEVFATGAAGTTATRTIFGTDNDAWDGSVTALAVSRDGWLYAGLRDDMTGGPQIQVFPPGTDGQTPPARTLLLDDFDSNGVGTRNVPMSIGLDDNGELFIGGMTRITVYDAAATGHAAPRRRLGPFQSLSPFQPLPCAVDAAGDVAVILDTGGFTPGIAVFGPGASGDATPVRLITGSSPAGPLAFGPDGSLYVRNGAGNISVYAPGASGNAAPMLTLPAKSGHAIAVQ